MDRNTKATFNGLSLPGEHTPGSVRRKPLYEQSEYSYNGSDVSVYSFPDCAIYLCSSR